MVNAVFICINDILKFHFQCFTCLYCHLADGCKILLLYYKMQIVYHHHLLIYLLDMKMRFIPD